MITPKEAATLIDWYNPQRRHELDEFVLSASARDLQLFVHHLSIINVTTYSRDWQARARMALDIRLAEEASAAAVKMQVQTDKIVRLTWGLFCLTIALTFVAAMQLYIMLK